VSQKTFRVLYPHPSQKKERAVNEPMRVMSETDS
jgi:hypothetical protein